MTLVIKRGTNQITESHMGIQQREYSIVYTKTQHVCIITTVLKFMLNGCVYKERNGTMLAKNISQKFILKQLCRQKLIKVNNRGYTKSGLDKYITF